MIPVYCRPTHPANASSQPPGRQPRPLRRCLDLGGGSPATTTTATATTSTHSASPVSTAAAAPVAAAGVGGLLSTAEMAKAFAASLGCTALPEQLLDPPSPHCHETLLPSPPSVRAAAGGGRRIGDDGDEAVQIALQVAPLFTSPTQAFEISRCQARRTTPKSAGSSGGKGRPDRPALAQQRAAAPFSEVLVFGAAAVGDGGGIAETVSAATLKRLVASGLDLAFPTASGGGGNFSPFNGRGGGGEGTPGSAAAGGSRLSFAGGASERAGAQQAAEDAAMMTTGAAAAAAAVQPATSTPASKDPTLVAHSAGIPFFAATPATAASTTTPATPAAPMPLM